jgi:hypothetical protein
MAGRLVGSDAISVLRILLLLAELYVILRPHKEALFNRIWSLRFAGERTAILPAIRESISLVCANNSHVQRLK